MRDGGSNSEVLLQKIQADGYDAILTAAIVDEQTETRYVPGNRTMYAPMPRFGWYGSFSGYYSHFHPMMFNDPGYYREDKVYFLETNLYDAATDRLLWSAQYQKVNPSNLEHASKRFSELAINTMHEQNLID